MYGERCHLYDKYAQCEVCYSVFHGVNSLCLVVVGGLVLHAVVLKSRLFYLVSVGDVDLATAISNTKHTCVETIHFSVTKHY